MRRSLTILVLLWSALVMIPPESTEAEGKTAASVENARIQTVSPEQELVDWYAPIVYLRTQPRACDRDAEGYFPAPVETVLYGDTVE